MSAARVGSGEVVIGSISRMRDEFCAARVSAKPARSWLAVNVPNSALVTASVSR